MRDPIGNSACLTGSRTSQNTHRSPGRGCSNALVIIQRLQDGGYITKRSIDGNKKERALFSTEKGHQLCDLHRRYDAMQTSALINDMLSFCTADEIDAYFKVLDYQIKAMQRGYGTGNDGAPFFSYSTNSAPSEDT